MSQFAAEFSNNEIIQQPVGRIFLGSIIIIMQKSKSHKRSFLEPLLTKESIGVLNIFKI